MDAVRKTDGYRVLFKRTPLPYNGRDLEILQYLSSNERRENPRNHAIPLLDVFWTSDSVFTVFPLLRELWIADFAFFGEGISFMEQTLEVCSSIVFSLITTDHFLTGSRLSTRTPRYSWVCLLRSGYSASYQRSARIVQTHSYKQGCLFNNFVMDPGRMFPRGFHPDRALSDARGRWLTGVRTRTQVGGVRYYYIDFGQSFQYDSNEQMRTTFVNKASIWAPEMEVKPIQPFDPRKTDIYQLGKTFKDRLLEV